jgi:crossover junction endodeoxyribonuclease RusA
MRAVRPNAVVDGLQQSPLRRRKGTVLPRSVQKRLGALWDGPKPYASLVDGVRMFYLHEPPSANRWWRMVRGRMVTSKEARQYKQDVQSVALASGMVNPIPKGTEVRVAFFWWRGRKSGDLDKRLGVLLDALQGVAYENDSQIVEIEAHRSDSPNPHACVVHITPAPVTG